jgi:phage terminase large subunit
MKTKTINIAQEVNPHFKTVWISKWPFNILRGGRNSFKSSVVALKLVFMMISYLINKETANIVVIRKVGKTLRDSVFLKVQWALDKFGLLNRFQCTVSPFKIRDTVTGSCFYFYGSDDFQKLKSNDIGNLIAVWYEEAAEFKSFEEFDQINVTFMRQKQPNAPFVQFFWSYNPPRNPYDWINRWSEEMKTNSNYLVHSSSYLDDELGLVTAQMLDEIERIKSADYDYYRYLYLGEAVGLGSNVYDMRHFHKLDEVPSDDPIVCLMYALDGGHQQSATACCVFGVTAKQKVILLDTYYYSPQGKSVKLAPSELSRNVYEFCGKVQGDPRYHNRPVMMRTIDSAEGALRNQYYKDYGIRWHPVAKRKKQTMIDMTYSFLVSGRFYYLNTQNNQVFIEEHRQYRYDDKTLDTPEPKVIKVADHTCDVLQYFVCDNAATLGLKV